MKIPYELAKKLKDAGFLQNTKYAYCLGYKNDKEYRNLHNLRIPEGYINLLAAGYEVVSAPILSELIDACGDRFISLRRVETTYGILWEVQGLIEKGKRPDLDVREINTNEIRDVAVANLYIKLNEK